MTRAKGYVDQSVPKRKPTDEEIKARLTELAERDTVRVLAVDPGDAHVGIAAWSRRGGIKSIEKDADVALAVLDVLLDQDWTCLVIEKFVLYPTQARAQSYSPMLTAEMIGALKWIASRKGTPVVTQGADIKEPTRRQCRARGLEWRDLRSGHASDARLHLLHYLLRNEIIETGEPV
jgi:hypothetical protein